MYRVGHEFNPLLLVNSEKNNILNLLIIIYNTHVYTLLLYTASKTSYYSIVCVY